MCKKYYNITNQGVDGMKIKDVEKIRLAELGILVAGGLVSIIPTGLNVSDVANLGGVYQSEMFQQMYANMFEFRNALPSKDVLQLISALPLYADVLAGAPLDMGTDEYKRIESLYEESLDRTSSLMKEFCLDEPISIFTMYVYLYRNGYLSHNHEFQYDFHLKDLPRLYGADVLNGNGVCRSLATHLSDLYNHMGYESETFAVHTSGEACRGLEHLCPTPLVKTERASKLVKMVNTATGIIHMPNHLILNVKQNGINYTLDPTNDGMLNPSGKNLLVPTSPNTRMILSLNATRVQRGIKQLKGGLSLKGLKEDLQMPTIDIEEYRKIYLETLKLCRENPDILEQFYLESQELYEEVHNLVEQHRGLMGRRFPFTKIKK
jgi:hypothetical protein